MKDSIKDVWFLDGRVYISTKNGNQYSQPLEMFPLLLFATEKERNSFYLWDNNCSIRWESIDEDIHISNFYNPVVVDYDNEVNRLLSCYPIDLKEFAKEVEIDWVKLARFKYGVWKPTEKTIDLIKRGIVSVGMKMVECV